MIKNKTRLFDILTLSDNNRRGSRLGDPVSVITAGVTLLSQLFPNIFGGGRKRLTDADWLELIPGSGYWTTALRNHLKSAIHYNNNVDNIQPFTRYFVDEHRSEIYPGLPPYPGQINETQYQAAFSKFMKILDQEKYSGGTSPVGNTPGGVGGTIDYSTLIPIAIGAVALVLIMKSKKKK